MSARRYSCAIHGSCSSGISSRITSASLNPCATFLIARRFTASTCSSDISRPDLRALPIPASPANATQPVLGDRSHIVTPVATALTPNRFDYAENLDGCPIDGHSAHWTRNAERPQRLRRGQKDKGS